MGKHAFNSIPGHNLRNSDGWKAFNDNEALLATASKRGKKIANDTYGIDALDERTVEDRFEESREFYPEE